MDTKTVSKKLHAYVIFIADLSELMKIIVSPLFVIYLLIYIYIIFYFKHSWYCCVYFHCKWHLCQDPYKKSMTQIKQCLAVNLILNLLYSESMQSIDNDDKKMFKLKSILEMYQPSCMYITTISNGSDFTETFVCCRDN